MSHIRELHTSKDEFVSKWKMTKRSCMQNHYKRNDKYLIHANTNYRALENDQRSALHWILKGGTHPKQGIVHTRKRIRLDLIPTRIMNRRGRGMRIDFSVCVCVCHINYLQAAGARSRTSAKKVILTCTDMRFGASVLFISNFRAFQKSWKRTKNH